LNSTPTERQATVATYFFFVVVGGSLLIGTLVFIVPGFIGLSSVSAPPSTPNTPQSSSNNTVTITSSSVPTTKSYTGWITYTSSVEKLSFKYPSNWTLDPAAAYAATFPSVKDYTAIKSPDGKATVHWTSIMTGYASTDSPFFPYVYVLDKTAIPGAHGDYVVSGATTLDGSEYYPWIAVQSANGGMLTSGDNGSPNTFMGRNNTDVAHSYPPQALLSTSGPRPNDNNARSFPSLSQADAYLKTPDMQEAKSILLSVTY
jgi:hypothetical protein